MKISFKKAIFPLAVLLTLVFAYLSVLSPIPDSVKPEVWQEIEKVLKEQKAKGDMIIVHPTWEDGALPYFQDNYLILGKPNNNSYIYYPKIWVILAHGFSKPDYLDNWDIGYEEEIKGLKVLRYDSIDAKQVLYDFQVKVADADVVIRKGKEVKACSEYVMMRHVCPIQPWNFFGPREMKVQSTQESCLWMHPLRGWSTQATYKKVPAGKRLIGEWAMSDESVELRGGAPVTLKIFINNHLVKTEVTRAWYGWHEFEIDTSKYEGKIINVRFEVTAAHDGLRHYCFRAQTRLDSLGAPRVNRHLPPTPSPQEVERLEKEKAAKRNKR